MYYSQGIALRTLLSKYCSLGFPLKVLLSMYYSEGIALEVLLPMSLCQLPQVRWRGDTRGDSCPLIRKTGIVLTC